jgi:hypothetical protein
MSVFLSPKITANGLGFCVRAGFGAQNSKFVRHPT